MKIQSHFVARMILALTICALPINAATIVDVDATALGLTDGDAIAGIAAGRSGEASHESCKIDLLQPLIFPRH